MEIAFTDFMQPDLSVEEPVMAAAGFSFRAARPDCGTEEEVIAFAGDAGALVVQEAPITRAVLEALPSLRIVSLPQVGFDSVDLEAAKDCGVWVTHVPDGNSTEVASHGLAMSLSLIRGLPSYDRSMRAGAWNYEAAGPLRRPGTLTLGILGLGRIGRLLAGYAAPLFGRVLGFDPYLPDAAWPGEIARAENLEELLATSDLLSLHMPLTDENQGLMNRQRLAQMKPGAYLINVSRGPMVETGDLADALDSGHLAGAALDVFPQEPPAEDDPVLGHAKVLLSPHAAFYSLESDRELRRRSIETIAALRDRGRPNNVLVEGTR